MKSFNQLFLIGAGAIALTLGACSKDSSTATGNSVTEATMKSSVITSLSANVILPTYADMNKEAVSLYTNIQLFIADGTDANLVKCRTSWYTMRAAWEQSEGFLFGPVATENVDPRIDTWPVNYQSLDSVLTSNSTFSSAYIETLEDALRGFHPIEYLLFGQNGDKKASDFTGKQKDYLLALAENLKTLSNSITTGWAAGFSVDFNNPSANGVYKNQREVYEQVVTAMFEICEEVADGKMSEPFTKQDASLEESPFAKNSMVDFTNNIKSVENMYLGTYGNGNDKGMEDFVRFYSLSLDVKIKQHIAAAKTALGNVTVPFGKAISEQPTQVQNAIDAIGALHGVIEEDLMDLVKLHTN
ncbi:MAG: imelysin family protein [Bacteroidota bacterium]